MNTPNPNPQAEFPPPIVNDVHLPRDPARSEIDGPEDATRINMATGECRIARLIRGVLYDTDHSTLVASVSCVDAANGYNLRRLYRTDAGNWFVVHLQWWHRIFATTDWIVWPLPDEAVLLMASSLVPDKDCAAFLLDWYGAGLVPRNDELAEHWAKDTLSGQDLEAARAAIASLPPEA